MKILSSKGRYFILKLVLGAGIILFIVSFYAVRRFENRQIYSDFKLQTSYYTEALKSHILGHLDWLHSISDFYSASQYVDRNEFSRFTKPILLRHPGIIELSWIPRVLDSERLAYEDNAQKDGYSDFQVKELNQQGNLIKAGQRPEYFPIYYIEPYKENSINLGFDVNVEPLRRQAMDKATDTGLPIETDLIKLLREKNKVAAYRVFLPIYRRDTPHDTIEERRKNLIGFVSLLVRIDQTVETVLKNFLPLGIDLYIYDKTTRGNDEIFHFHGCRLPHKGDAGLNNKESWKESGFILQESFDAAGRKWLFVYQATPEFLARYPHWQSWIALAFGLILTFILFFYLSNILNRAAQIQLLVDERTAELRESEDRHRTLYTSSKDAIMMVIPGKKFIAGNPATVEMFGCKDEEEFIAQSLASLSPEYQPDGLPSTVKSEKMMAIAMEKGSHFFEWTHKRLDGREFYATVLLTRMELKGQRVLQATVRDITYNKLSEERIRHAVEEWQRTFDSISDALFIQDADFTIIKANKFFSEMLKLKPEQIIGRKCYEVLHKLNKPWPGCPFDETRTDNKPHTKEVDDPNIGVPLLVSTSPIFDEKGKLLGSVHIAKDISEIKKAREELEKKNKELEKLGEMKSDFVSQVSHELRTPMASIKEGIDIVLDGSAGQINKEQKGFLDIAKRNVDRLARLINNILDLQKIESGRTQFNIQENDLNATINEVCQSIVSLVKDKGLDFIVKLDNALPKVQFDKDKIIQVLTNLVSNAVKFTERGNITVTANRQDDFIQVAVEDSGKGIKEEDLPKLFQKFMQLEKGLERKTGGTGLGLLISKEIIEAHKGRIWAKSEFGKGSTFYFSLPVK